MILCTFLYSEKPRAHMSQPKGASLSEEDLLTVFLRANHLRGRKLPSLYLNLGLYLMKMDLLALSGMERTIAVPMTHCLPYSMIFGPRIPEFGLGDSEALAMSF